MRLLGVDPGKTTGLVYYDTETKEVLRYGQTADPLVVLRMIAKQSSKKALDAVVIEDFIGSGPRDVNVIHTLKVLGGVLYFCKLIKLPIFVQQPQYRKAFLIEAAAAVGEGMHYTDAMAHVLAFAYHHKSMVEEWSREHGKALPEVQGEVPRGAGEVGSRGGGLLEE